MVLRSSLMGNSILELLFSIFLPKSILLLISLSLGLLLTD